MLAAMLLAAAVAASTPEALVTRFCAAYVHGDAGASGLLGVGNARAAMAPYLSRRLLRLLDDTQSCQQDWIRHQPKDDDQEVPFGECCLFSSTSEGLPASFRIGNSERMSDGRIRVVIHYEWKSDQNGDPLRWRDAAIVTKEEGRYVIDDFVYDVDHEPTLLSKNIAAACRGRKWIGKR